MSALAPQSEIIKAAVDVINIGGPLVGQFLEWASGHKDATPEQRQIAIAARAGEMNALRDAVARQREREAGGTESDVSAGRDE